MASAIVLHLSFRRGKSVWKSSANAHFIERALCCWPNSNAGIANVKGTNENAWFSAMRIEHFQRMRKEIPMTHAVLIDPRRNVLDAWIRHCGMPAIHVSRNYNDDLAYEHLSYVNVSSLYRSKTLLEKMDRPTYAGYDYKAKVPMVVPVIGIKDMVFLPHAINRLKQELVCCDDLTYAGKDAKPPCEALALFKRDSPLRP